MAPRSPDVGADGSDPGVLVRLDGVGDQLRCRSAHGDVSGPYEVWQVAGCVLTLAVLAVVAARWLNAGWVTLVMSLSFTAGVSISAAAILKAGPLWPIGASMIFAGTACGVAFVAFVARLAWHPPQGG